MRARPNLRNMRIFPKILSSIDLVVYKNWLHKRKSYRYQSIENSQKVKLTENPQNGSISLDDECIFLQLKCEAPQN